MRFLCRVGEERPIHGARLHRMALFGAFVAAFSARARKAKDGCFARFRFSRPKDWEPMACVSTLYYNHPTLCFLGKELAATKRQGVLDNVPAFRIPCSALKIRVHPCASVVESRFLSSFDPPPGLGLRQSPAALQSESPCSDVRDPGACPPSVVAASAALCISSTILFWCCPSADLIESLTHSCDCGDCNIPFIRTTEGKRSRTD